MKWLRMINDSPVRAGAGMIWLLFFILLPHNSLSYPADTTFSLQMESHPRYLLWVKKTPDSPTPCSDAALRGLKGFRLSNNRPGHISQEITFQKDSWQRFHLRIDSCFFKSGITDEMSLRYFFSHYSVSEKTQRDVSNDLLNFFFRYQGPDSDILFVCQANSSFETVAPIEFASPLSRGQIYCVETHLDFFAPDSLHLQCYLDGRLLGEQRLRYMQTKEFFRVRLASPDQDVGKWVVSVDEFTVSSKRLFTLPQKPLGCQTSVQPDTILLKCDSFQTSYFGEFQNASRWRVFSPADTMFPLYDVVDNITSFYSRRVLPFSFDRGDYQWQVCRQNNYKNWSDWSTPAVFSIPDQRPLDFVIQNVYFTLENSSKPLSSIVSGQWYSMHIEIKPNTAWDSLIYMLIWLNDSSYTFGNPGNRGGAFHASSNYIWNLSLQGGVYIFEKPFEGSVLSRPVSPDTLGYYADASPKAIRVNKKGNIRLRVRLLKEANPGQWQLSAVIFSTNGVTPIGKMLRENQSNLFHKRIIVLPAQAGFEFRSRLALVAILIIILSLCAYFYWKKNHPIALKKPYIVPHDENLIKIIDYITLNLAKKLTAQEIRSKLGLSQHRFYDILKLNQTSLPTLINECRLNKAKELLINTELTMAEIAYSVGFTPTYFANIFKWVEGITPLEFRKKMQKMN